MMRKLVAWYRRWRSRKQPARTLSSASLAVEQLETRQMLAAGACVVLDVSSPPDDIEAVEIALPMPENRPQAADSDDLFHANAMDSKVLVVLDDFAEELGRIVVFEVDDLWWMRGDDV